MTGTDALVRCSVDAEGIATVEMRDGEGRNALSERFAGALTAVLAEAAAAPAAKVIVLVGLPDVFCSGAPKALLRELVNGGVAPSDIQLPRTVLGLPLPLIAAMEGHAIGGGLALAACADIVIAARESRYGCTFMNMGLTPGMGTTRVLEHCMSPGVAHELMFSGELMLGRALEGRAFNYVLPRADVRAKAMELAARIAEKPRVALETLKRGLAARRLQAFAESFGAETAMHTVALAQPEIRRLIEDEYVE
jgi:polyketide biosynthesis enoyl-CoA hydratase PksI